MSEESCIENPERITIDTITLEGKYKTRLNIKEALVPSSRNKSALLILNQQITLPLPLFLKLWKSYEVKVCADGGANKLYKYLLEHSLELDLIPDYIIGDLDSLDADISTFYLKHGVVIIKQLTQYSTDFTKSVNLISLHFCSNVFRQTVTDLLKVTDNFGISLEKGIHELYNEMKSEASSEEKKESGDNKISILALGGIGGRFDQSIHSITQLYILRKSDPNICLSYLSQTDVIMLIPKRGCLIDYPDMEFRDNCIGNCGLLPIGVETNIIETRGLKWDVFNWQTSVKSGRVSSSNRFVGINQCFINVQDDIVLNIEICIDKLIEYI